MSINIQDTFQVNIGSPIDTRIVATTSAIREAITYKYDGLSVFQLSDRKTYVWNQTTSTWSSSDITGAGQDKYFARFEGVYGLTTSSMYMVVGSAPTKGRIGINSNDPKEIVQINADTGVADPFVISQATNTILATNWYNDGADRTFTSAQPSMAIKFTRADGSINFLSRASSTTALNSSDSFNSNIVARFTLSQINLLKDLNLNNNNSNTSAAYIRATASNSTTALPDYTWNNDKGTGIYHPSSGRMGFSINGSQKAVLTTNGLLISGSDTTLTTPNQRLHINGNTGAETFIAISNGTTTGIGGFDSFLIGVNNLGWPQLQSRFTNKPILIRFSNNGTGGNGQGGNNFYHIARNFFTIFSADIGEGFANTSASPATIGDRVIYGTKSVTFPNVNNSQYRVISTMNVPDDCMVTVESVFNTSIIHGVATKQFRMQKIISCFTVNSSGIILALANGPDYLADNSSSVASFINGNNARVISAGANTLSFEVYTGSGATPHSGRSVVSFTATINNYQGH
jgi:hypothetical protein